MTSNMMISHPGTEPASRRARCALGTKAETLTTLREHVQKAKVPRLAYFTVGQWRRDSQGCIDAVGAALHGASVAVRSSSLAEDSWNASNAGAFASLLNIDSRDGAALRQAIDTVIASYESDLPDNQVLVQEMVKDVVLSGVLFTRSIDHDAPYYVINYDDRTGLTDTVTSGSGDGLKTVFAYKDFPEGIAKVDRRLVAVVKAAIEVEQLTGQHRLDIEFAASATQVYLLQARPLVRRDDTGAAFPDALFDQMLNKAFGQVAALQKRQPYLHGDTTVLGVMPDANPAELIGIKPRPLAFSLYRHLITDDLFASVRAAYGYRDVAPYPMMVSVLGQPFIDTRVSFNSLTPAGMAAADAEAVIDTSLRKLAANPDLHDKVEFDIIVNCWFAGIEKTLDERFGCLDDAGKTDYIAGLRGLTREAIVRIDQDLRDTRPLQSRFDEVIVSDLPPLRKAMVLLEDAQRLGAGPFIRLARSGFVAMTMLKSLVTEGAITQKELDEFMGSLHTVSKQIETSAYAVKTGKTSLDDLVAQYGHLRPGTYDILSQAYFEDPERFLRPVIDAAREDFPGCFEWTGQPAANMRKVFDAAGLDISVPQFEYFCRKAIEGREYGKFIYTKNMSYALEYVRRWGEEKKLSRDDVSFLKWHYLKDLALGLEPVDDEMIQAQIDAGRSEYELLQAVELPALITSPEDVFAFERRAAQANFITSRSVTAELAVLNVHVDALPDLAGKIVLIPGADPGYDWLFSQNIAGLITMFGGANSHMAIRSAEQGLPAAIGVGQKIYGALSQAHTIALNCAGRTIKSIH